MAVETPGRSIGTQRAAADLSVKANFQYRAVVLDSTGRIARNTSAGGKIFGILQNDPALNQAATVMIDGVSKMRAGAALTVGAKVMSDAAGRAVLATTGLNIIGTCLIAAAAEGEIISVSLDRQGVV
jgi:hypothetical protein